MVLLVCLEMLGQVIDSLREQRNLHVGRPCIPFVELEIVNRFRFRFHILHCGNLSRLLNSRPNCNFGG